MNLLELIIMFLMPIWLMEIWFPHTFMLRPVKRVLIYTSFALWLLKIFGSYAIEIVKVAK